MKSLEQLNLFFKVSSENERRLPHSPPSSLPTLCQRQACSLRSVAGGSAADSCAGVCTK